MSEADYIVTANCLNLREVPGIDAAILRRLYKGDVVTFIEASPTEGWWHVRSPDGLQEGFVARQYLLAKSTVPPSPFASVNQVLWDMTTAYAGKISYGFGNKNIATGSIDCSGWVGLITSKAFDEVNTASAPQTVFAKSAYRVLDTHSDGIITGIEAHTGRVLKGPQVILAALREGMLIGCNFGQHSWELGTPPRVYGIDHIVQVVRDPDDDKLYITQSSDSGHGVNRVVLADWLTQYKGLVDSGRMYAVDPFAMADPNVTLAQPSSSPAAANAASSPVIERLARFSGRSVFVYLLDDVLKTFGTVTACIDELKRCKVENVWLRVHGRGYEGDSKGGDIAAQKAFADAIKAAGLGVAGWGWCQGEDPAAEAALAVKALNTFGLSDYMADIEQGVNNANWTAVEIAAFVGAFRQALPSAPLCITSHGFIDWHEPDLFNQVKALGVDGLCPQTYWSDHYPSAKMLAAVGAMAAQYPLGDPSAYVRLCCDRWKRYGLPVIPAGQTCTDEYTPEVEANNRLNLFLGNPPPAGSVAGIAYWYWSTTTQVMRDSLATY